ncbi:MAG: hypothetical protein OEM32_10725, partial [Acidimicrobiia bacterium]|nr:hypothetical protein [Acidimicrobiia bacterium]
MRRILLLSVAVGGLMLIGLAASAVDLDQTVCENDLGGTWTGGTSTCDSGLVFDLPSPLVVPSGVTWNLDILEAFGLDVSNFGTVVVISYWHNHGQLDNYGSFTVDAMIHDSVVNHCGSTYSMNIDSSASVVNLDCSVLATLSADPTNGTAPLDIDWTVTLENDGDEALDTVSIELSTDGGATAFSTLTAPPDSGDDGDGVLEPGETWQYVVQTTESADVTVTATAFGTAPSGLVVTFPGDAEAQVAAAVVVAAAPTTTTTSTTSTTVPGSSTTTSGASTTSSGEVAAGT